MLKNVPVSKLPVPYILEMIYYSAPKSEMLRIPDCGRPETLRVLSAPE